MLLDNTKINVIDLSKHLDPETESRRCKLRRFNTGGPIPDFHTDMDLTTHLGTHVETPYHHDDNWPDVLTLPVTNFIGRCVYLNITTCEPNAHISAEDLEAASRGRVKEGDVVIIDSPYKLTPFTELTNTDVDKRLFIGVESANWFKEKGVKSVGFGDGVSIENSNEDVKPFHDILMAENITFIEVLKNLEQLTQEIFMIIFLPLPIKGIDSSPVRVVAVEGLAEFSE
ncbi:MAG: cyclase family protein [Sphaerochaetaceae bacterium]|nr:cyclase family protein [Sphaerochaetaceae bacterium]MDC7236205.1 cyclase family protein [Sphaerochaetaceae bacterium]MDC7250919.1 cyclase family protein [Sphaerochaetaceae bacterium]